MCLALASEMGHMSRWGAEASKAQCGSPCFGFSPYNRTNKMRNIPDSWDAVSWSEGTPKSTWLKALFNQDGRGQVGAGEGAEKREPRRTVGGECELVQRRWKTARRFLKQLETITVSLRNRTSGCISERDDITISKRYPHAPVHSSRDMGTT